MLTSTIPVYTECYTAPVWLPDGNSQTIYPYLNKPKPLFQYRRERWELDDGDFIDVDWGDGATDAPLVVFFHGLEGDSSSHYILSMINTLQPYGWRSAVVHFRGCSGTPNRLARAYHSGDSPEIDWMLHRMHREHAHSQPIYVVGVSLGGNVLLKWAGESGEYANQIIAGIATISVPLDLAAAGTALDVGFNQIYARHFLISLRAKGLQKAMQFPGLLNKNALKKCNTIYDFDNIVTAPLHGFRDTDEYWRISSSKQWLPHIRVPTLVINARNDPFVPAASLPSAHNVSSTVLLEFPQQGGHAGFMRGPFPGKLDWLPQRILGFFYHQC